MHKRLGLVTLNAYTTAYNPMGRLGEARSPQTWRCRLSRLLRLVVLALTWGPPTTAISRCVKVYFTSGSK